MKKTLLATAIAGALGASAAAQAATVYDQDGTRLDVNGRIAMGISGGGEETQPGEDKQDGTEFRDVYSRLGLTMSHDINRDLRAFGRIEWRFSGDERNTSSGFNEVRHSYIGLESAQLGTLMAGNFDSFYNSYVVSPFDVYIDRGFEFSKGLGGDLQARGDSLGYITPDLGGFSAFVAAKHYTGNDLSNHPEFDDEGDLTNNYHGDSRSSVINTQGGVSYEFAGLRLAAGFAQDRDDPAVSQTRHAGGEGRGADENIYGATASYAFNDAFSARLGYETQDSNNEMIDAGNSTEQYGGYDTWGLGATYAMGDWSFNADVYRVSPDYADNRTAWAAGAYYKVSSNFDVFTELNRADQGDITVSTSPDVEVEENDDSLFWLVGARYHF